MEAVLSEPFSALNSLLTGKNTGNFSLLSRKFQQRIPSNTLNLPEFSYPWSELGAPRNRELLCRNRELSDTYQGNDIFPDIKKCPSGSSIFFTMRPAPAPRLICKVMRFGVNFTRSRFYGNLPNSVIDPNRSVSRWPHIAN